MFWQSFKNRSSLMAWCQQEKVLFIKDALVFHLLWLSACVSRQFSSCHGEDAESLWYPLCGTLLSPRCHSACPEAQGQSWARIGLAGASVALAVLPFYAKRSLQEACPGFLVTKLFPAAVLECFLRISTEKSNHGYFLGGFWWFLRY